MYATPMQKRSLTATPMGRVDTTEVFECGFLSVF